SQRGIATAINAPPRDLADDGVGKDGLPRGRNSFAKSANNTFLYGGGQFEPSPSGRSFSAKGGTIVLVLLLVLAGVLSIPFLARSNHGLDDYTPSTDNATHIDGVPWNIRGVGADSH